MGSEIIRILSAGAKQRLEHGGQRGFVDATQEEGPPEEDSSLSGTESSPSSTSQPVDGASGALPSIPEE
eukprot:4569348-Karenia_brevis.AAC.1